MGVMHCAVRSVSVGGWAAAVAVYQPVAASCGIPLYERRAGSVRRNRRNAGADACRSLSSSRRRDRGPPGSSGTVASDCREAWCCGPSHPSLPERRGTAPRSRAPYASSSRNTPPRCGGCSGASARRREPDRESAVARASSEAPSGWGVCQAALRGVDGRRVVDTLAFARPDRQDCLSSIMRGWLRRSCSRASPSRHRPAM